MAIMIPKTPRDLDPRSKEDVMFKALEALPDSYYVFHSFRIISIEENEIHESETDFVVFEPTKGILCLEAKAGSGIHFKDGEWYYTSERVMQHGGPFGQARRNMYAIKKHIEDSPMKRILPHCKFVHAVWFPDITSEQLHRMTFPPEANKELTLTTESLYEPQSAIEKLFDHSSFYGKDSVRKTEISDYDANILVRNVFCPEFNVFPSPNFDKEATKIAFHRLLKEQANILNFLEDQKSAAINGAAGTGKTMIAVEKARRNADKG